MHSPELLLKDLNGALRELLGATAALNDTRIDDELRPAAQRLLLAEVLGNTTILAVCGSQGAGKTTLVATLYEEYGAHEWLKPNQGRGERLPVLILEEPGRKKAQGYVRQFARRGVNHTSVILEDAEVGVDAFNDACCGRNPAALLPVLKVPTCYFAHSNEALMLLPGYEAQTGDNRQWQELMRQGLIGASGCLIVTDMSRSATHQNQEINADSRQIDKAASPVVIVTRTEGFAGDEARLRSTRETVGAVFGIDESRGDHPVICAGVGDPAYVREWRPQLGGALRRLAASAPRHRNAQLAHLEQVLRRELANALSRLRSRAQPFMSKYGGADDNGQAMVARIIEVFDDSCASLREDFRQDIVDALASRHGEASKKLDALLTDHHEGMWNKAKGIFDKETESRNKLEADLRKAWAVGGPVLDTFANVAGALVRRDLQDAPLLPHPEAPALPSPETESDASSAQASNDYEDEARFADVEGHAHATANGDALRRIGYIDANNAPVAWSKPDAATLHNLHLIFGNRGALTTTDDPHSNVALEDAIRLLPVLGLEYARVASLLPAIVGVMESGDGVLPQADLSQAVARMQNDFVAFRNSAGQILKGLTFIMAIDFFADGKIDTIPAIFNALTASAGAGVASAGTGAAGAGAASAGAAASAVGAAVAGVVTVGVLFKLALDEVRRHDRLVSAFAHDALLGIRDQHEQHFVSHFDRLMAGLRTRLKLSLHRRYGLNQRLMEQDRLSKALADVRMYQRDLLEEIARSGLAVDVFHGAAAA
jgi:hypothetical protein